MPAKPSYRYFEPLWGSRAVNRRAWECLERCRTRLGLDEIPLPVPVEAWIERPLRIRFGFANLSYLGEGVLGAALATKREILIDEQVLSHEGRLRFTAAHELGHVILHAKVAKTFHDTLDYGLSSHDQFEREANRFAAAFLMPVPIFERELLALCDGMGIPRAKCFAQLMDTTPEAESLWRRRFLPPLARRFTVSIAAAAIRCSDIQPRIPRTRPLLSRELVQRLLKPAGKKQVEFEFESEAQER